MDHYHQRPHLGCENFLTRLKNDKEMETMIAKMVAMEDVELEVDDELHVVQYQTRLVSKSQKERFDKLMSKGTRVLMRTTPKD
mgnify:CR=1 FL=1